MDKTPLEQSCELSSGQVIAYRRWGNTNASVKILAMHGWLDNCASFNPLAQNLDDVDLVAIDLPGHGISSHRAGLSAYNIWDDVLDLVDLLDRLQWSSLFLLGHSRGAMISTIFAGSYPERIRGAVLIDAFAPLWIGAEQQVQQLRQYLDAVKRGDYQRRSYFDSMEDAIRARSRGFVPLGYDAAKLLAERGVSKSEQGFYWGHDTKLNLPSEVKFSFEQCKAFVDAYPIAALVIRASEGMLHDKNIFSSMSEFSNLDVLDIKGNHHLHLDSSESEIKALADIITNYIERHDQI